jgi:hypothetical protein
MHSSSRSRQQACEPTTVKRHADCISSITAVVAVAAAAAARRVALQIGYDGTESCLHKGQANNQQLLHGVFSIYT